MRHTPAIAAGLLALTACGATGSADRPDVDARRYYEEYSSGTMDMATASGPIPNAAPSAGAGDATSAVEVEVGVGVGVPDWPDPTEDNVFVDSGDSRFVSTRDDAESTFALDVDTGSYRVGLAQLAGGVRPDPGSIRVEEWINAFDDGDAASTDGAVGVTVETADAPHTTTARSSCALPSTPPPWPTRTARRRTSRSSSTPPDRWASATASASCSRRSRCSSSTSTTTRSPSSRTATRPHPCSPRRRWARRPRSSPRSTSSPPVAARTWRPASCSATSRRARRSVRMV